MTKKIITPKEREEQVGFFRWISLHPDAAQARGLIFAVPNGARVTIGQGVKLKAEGLMTGVPDIFLALPKGRYHGLFIEMKRIGGRKPGTEQVEWMNRLKDKGYAVALCFGAEEAKTDLIKYIDGKWGKNETGSCN